MTDKVSDVELRNIVASVRNCPETRIGQIARELLTLRQREREARELLKEAVFVFETYRHKRFVWLSEGTEHE